jgi:hypothetical protein
MLKKVSQGICFLTLLLIPLSLAAEESDEPAKVARLFESDDILAVTISAPWQEIERNRKYQGTYPATIEYTDSNGKQQSHQLTVERRGIKRQEACRIPPIRLRFEKDEVKDTMFRGQTSLKMVTHCQNSSRYDQYYVLEMMAYRMYNRVTDYSFRVRPLSVTYRDSQKDDVEADRFGFLIEDDSDVAKRNDLKKLVIPYTLPSRFDLGTSSDMALFQLMIGNTDYSPLRGPDPAECCHNVKLIAPRPLQDGDIIWPVPYDFDASGIVDAPYAAPPDGLGVNSVTQRVYRGYCAHNDTMQASRQKIISLESEIMSVLDSDPRLTERFRKKADRYLEKYFDLLKDDKDFERLVVTRCRK